MIRLIAQQYFSWPRGGDKVAWNTHARQNNDRLLQFVSLLTGTCLVRKSEGILFLKMECGVRLKSGWLFFMLWIKLYTT